MKRMFSCLCLGRRRRRWAIVLVALVTAATLKAWWFSELVGEALAVPAPPDHDLTHLRRSRDLKHYLDNTQLLLEPSSTSCEGAQEVPFVAVVSSAPPNVGQRAAIRATWAPQQPTFFVVGLDTKQDSLADTYLEAKEYGDMVVFDFTDHYQNLTLKTALMLRWARRRCPHVGAVFKTDDDVLVNPWVMRDLIMLYQDKQLIGYKVANAKPHRDPYTKWYMPRWLFPSDTIPEYLSGTGYVIQGEYIESILKTAYTTPMVNLEDVYFTYNVAKATLGMTLTHERRFSPYKPWLKTACAFWTLASAHSLSPQEMVEAWAKIEPLGWKYYQGESICSYSGFLARDFFLY